MLGNMQDALAAMIMPNGFLPPLGDGKFTDVSSLNILAANSEDNYSETLLVHISGGNLGKASSNELFFSKDAGLVTYQTVKNPNTNSFLAATAAFHSRVHKQIDDLSVFWAENGLSLIHI